MDEATVDLENVHVHLTRGKKLSRAALDATNETRVPRLLAMLCIVAMFTPAFFMAGAARAMFLPLALAVAFCMVASYLLSSTVVPILSIWLLRHRQTSSKSETRFAPFQKAYARLLNRAMSGRSWILALYLVVTVAVIFLAGGKLRCTA